MLTKALGVVIIFLLATCLTLGINLKIKESKLEKVSADLHQKELDLKEAQKANDDWVAINNEVKKSLKTCEKDRIVEKENSERAVDDLRVKLGGIQSRYNNAVTKALLEDQGYCKEWASKPACGMTP